MSNQTVALGAGLILIALGLPVGAQQLVPPVDGGLPDADCIGVNARGEADHEVTPNRPVPEGEQGAGFAYSVADNDAAYIEPDGTAQNAQGITVTWFYRVTGKNSDIECRSPIKECPDGAEADVARAYSDELLEQIEAGNEDSLPPPPACPG